MLVHTIDFQHREQEIKLWISREDLWKVMYPVSAGIYIAFLAIPVYDPVCTICFCAGIFSKAIVTEWRRGYYWNRPSARKGLLAAITLLGAVQAILIFICGYMAMLENTNQGWERHETWKHEMIGLVTNATDQTPPVPHLTDENVTDENLLEIILDENGMFKGDADRQYVNWFFHAYPAKCWMWWFTCFYAGPLLDSIPGNMRMPVIVEKSQMSTFGIAMAALFVVLGVTRSSAFDFVQIQSAMGDIYLLFGAPCIWACIFCLCHSVREKSSLGLTVPLSIVSLVKSFTMLRADFWEKQNAQVFVASSVVSTSYLVSVVYFMRVENVAIRSGWGTRGNDLEVLSDGDDDFSSVEALRAMHNRGDSTADADDSNFSVQENAENDLDSEVPIADKSLQP